MVTIHCGWIGMFERAKLPEVLGLPQVSRGKLPIHEFPEGMKVTGLLAPMIQVVGMLPKVACEQRLLARADRAVACVPERMDGETAVGLQHQPHPA